MDTLCAQLLLQFYDDPFQILHMFLSWSEYVHVIWILSSDYFLLLFCILILVIFEARILSKCIDSG